MANTPIHVRFTDEIYATRFEVAKTLGTNLIDPLWNEIIKYRNTMKHIINVLDISHLQYYITITAKNDEKISTIPASLRRFTNEYEALLGGDYAKDSIEKELLRLSLRNIAKINNIEVSDVSLDKVIDHKSFEVSHLLLARYLEALQRLLPVTREIDEEFLAETLQILRGENELTSFYRTSDIESASSRYLISREYDGAPAHDIEFLMSNLFSYLKEENEPLINKIASVIYMFDYVKPFDNFNREISIIVIKKLLGPTSVFVPFESLLNITNYSNIVKEVQKSRDLTYLFIPVADQVEATLLLALDKITQLNGKTLSQAYNAGDDEKEFEKEFGFKPQQDVLAPKLKEFEEEVKEIKVEEPKIESKLIIDRPKPVQTPKPKVVEKEEPKKVVPEYNEEKELKKRANDLLESDPYLKKGQAHFYVRHCAKGKYYTIQQYKKEEGCVYETARTSMDTLAKLGYYRREQIKNKFVYTPIEK